MCVSAVLTHSAAGSSSSLSSCEEVHGDRIFLPLDFAGLCKNLLGLCLFGFFLFFLRNLRMVVPSDCRDATSSNSWHLLGTCWLT